MDLRKKQHEIGLKPAQTGQIELTRTDVLFTAQVRVPLLGNVTHYYYDADGNPTSTVDALGNTTSQTYTATGQVATRTDAKGAVTQYFYDSDDRLIEALSCQHGRNLP